LTFFSKRGENFFAVRREARDLGTGFASSCLVGCGTSGCLSFRPARFLAFIEEHRQAAGAHVTGKPSMSAAADRRASPEMNASVEGSPCAAVSLLGYGPRGYSSLQVACESVDQFAISRLT
jgi:hypothetical protein